MSAEPEIFSEMMTPGELANRLLWEAGSTVGLVTFAVNTEGQLLWRSAGTVPLIAYSTVATLMQQQADAFAAAMCMPTEGNA